jgi:hypothetical protein
MQQTGGAEAGRSHGRPSPEDVRRDLAVVPLDEDLGNVVLFCLQVVDHHPAFEIFLRQDGS